MERMLDQGIRDRTEKRAGEVRSTCHMTTNRLKRFDMEIETRSDRGSFRKIASEGFWEDLI